METTKVLDARRRVVAVRASALVLASACAAASGVAAAAGLEGSLRDGQYAPSAPAATYGSEEGRKCQSSPTATYTLEYMSDAAKRSNRPAPRLDARLCALAESFVAMAPGSVPRPQVLAFAAHWFGIPGTVNVPIVADFDVEDQRTVAERVVQSAAGSAALNAVNPRVGIATQRIRKGRQTITRVSIVVSDVALELTPPVPRRLDKGQQAKLSGKLVGGVKNPKVFVTDSTGKLEQPPQQPGDTFEATLACGDRPGKIQVEIRGEFEGSSGLIASFPVSCTEAPPASIALGGEPWPTDVEAAAKKAFELVNAERTGAGAPALTWDAAIAGVARDIAADIAKSGASAGGDVVERLKKEGISSPLVLQSAAADRTFERAHERILSSPRDRATVLNPDATHAGLGAVAATDAEGHPVVYLVEVLVKQLPPVDVANVRQQLRDAVAQKRKDARTNAVTPDETLDQVAEKFAQALAQAGGTLPKEQATALTAPLNKSFRSVTMISGAKQEPLDFAEESQATATGKALGVGVAQGRHPVLGRNAVYVVLMVGTPRAGASDEAAPAKKKSTKPSTTKPTATKK